MHLPPLTFSRTALVLQEIENSILGKELHTRLERKGDCAFVGIVRNLNEGRKRKVDVW